MQVSIRVERNHDAINNDRMQRRRKQLANEQSNWDANRHKQAYLKDHPNHPTYLKSEGAMSVARLVRL